MAHAHNPTFTIVHTAVLDCLDVQAVKNSLRLGAVYDQTGTLIPTWRTYHAREIVFIRSTKVVTYRYCDECGALLYQSHGRRSALYPAPKENIIYQTELGDLLCHESLVSPELYKHRRKLTIWRIGVSEKPLDGLSENLEYWRSSP